MNMNEMLHIASNKGEKHMKKTLIVVAIAAALVFALGATPAFAKYAGYSAAKQYVPWTEASSMASLSPDAATRLAGPHSGYATTTIKCAVCHSVHRGGSSLLNQGAVCAYCHTNASWGGGSVSNKLISWGSNSVAGNGATVGPHSSCASTYCHGGPHGVGASVYAGPASRLLTDAADAKLVADAAANGVATSEFATYSSTTRALSTGAVCSRTGCHTGSAFGVVASGSELPVDPIAGSASASDGLVTGHRVVAAATSTWNANGTDFPTSATNLTIAYAGVGYCSSCHDLADDNNSGRPAFPHAIDGVIDAAAGATGLTRPAAWLTAGAYAGATRTAVGPYDRYTGDGATVGGSAGSPILDGVCLKCHRGSATSGVGYGY